MRRIARLRRPVALLQAGPSVPRCLPAATIAANIPAPGRVQRRDWSATPVFRDDKAGPADRRQPSPSLDNSVSDDIAGQQQQQHQGDAMAAPPRMHWADRPDQIKDAQYTPADSIDGLETVGGYEHWMRSADWGKPDDHFTFAPSANATRPLSPSVLEVRVRQALAEALVVSQAAPQALTSRWAPAGRDGLDAALAVDITVADDGSATVATHSLPFADRLVGDAAVAVAVADDVSTTKLPESAAAELAKAVNSSWKKASLADMALKFAVNKRIFQLTGLRVPDASLPSINTAGQLHSALVKPPAPKKLRDELARQPEFAPDSLPSNVKLHAKRVTPIHRAKADGSWKVIQRELERRGLPVTGKGDYGPPTEKAWQMGEAETMNKWRVKRR